MSLEITPSLKASLGTLYCKTSLDQKGWAYVSLGDVGAKPGDNVIVFEKGVRRISVKVPAQAMHEITRLAASADKCFDYLACKVGDRHDGVIVANPLGLCWVKAGKGAFSNSQIDALEKTGLQVAVFAIRDVLAPPGKVQARLDVRTAKEWLDELDDLRDQAESDDDYL
ncbi:MAG: hypothetical protein ACREAY_05465 [Nitrososphaera sp.]|uniref:hypothetical protein n=1 Tax=Nitrososphaera sp. TaxID=1971748 RepID=UPI003D6EA382